MVLEDSIALALAVALLGPARAIAEDEPRLPAKGQPSLAETGARVYRAQCAHCHGLAGDGQGPAAHALDPLPRDFRTGAFKFRSTPSGELPVDADLVKTVTFGLPGSAMNAFGGRLSSWQIEAVVQYIKRFSLRFAEEEPGAPVSIPKVPDTSLSKEVAAAAWERVGCHKCHGAEGRSDGPSAAGLVDDQGRHIITRDLAYEAFRAGSEPQDIFRTLSTGLDGTPMPSYRDSLTDEELWQVVFYVRSMRRSSFLHAIFGPLEDQKDW